MSVESTIAKHLADKGIILDAKHNSIFTAIDEYGMGHPIVAKAIRGLGNAVTADINRYRNVIIPDAKELCNMVSEASVGKQVNPADKVVFHVLSKYSLLDTLVELNKVDPRVVANASELPDNPLVIAWDEKVVATNIRLGNNVVATEFESIINELGKDIIHDVHEKIFTNVSRNSEYLTSVGYNVLGNYGELVVGLMLTLGYIEGDLGITNRKVGTVRSEYLYQLRDIFVTLITNYRTTYDNAVNSEVVIVNKDTTKRGMTTLTIVSDVYDKYLDDNSIDAIIGFGLSDSTDKRVRLSQLIENADKYISVYQAAVKAETVKAALGKVNAIRTLYEMKSVEFMNNISDDRKDVLGLTDETIASTREAIAKYVKGLSDEEVLDITNVTRIIVGTYVYTDTSFMDFVGYMNYYAKVYDKFTPDELATLSSVAITIDYLEDHISESSVGN